MTNDIVNSGKRSQSLKIGLKRYQEIKKALLILRAHHHDSKNTSTTAKHIKNATPFSFTFSLFDAGCQRVVVRDSVKCAELQSTAHIACHSSINTVSSGTSDKKFAIHRTKCTALMKQVLGPTMFDDLLQDIGNTEWATHN